jgi:hypothetical protein
MDLTRLLSGFALGMLIASQVTRLHAQGGLAADGWSGQVQCVLRAQTPGYEDVQTHTWVLSGAAPIARANFRDYPATWTVSGNGSRTPLPGLPGGAGGASTDTWTRSGSDANAYLTIFEPIGTRNLRIAPGQIPLRASAGLAVTTAVRVPGGATTPISSSSFDADEWRFPYIDTTPAAGTMSGSRTQMRTALVGWRQPSGAPVTETCTWNFTKGGAAPASGTISRAPPNRLRGTLSVDAGAGSPAPDASPPAATATAPPTMTAGVLTPTLALPPAATADAPTPASSTTGPAEGAATAAAPVRQSSAGSAISTERPRGFSTVGAGPAPQLEIGTPVPAVAELRWRRAAGADDVIDPNVYHLFRAAGSDPEVELPLPRQSSVDDLIGITTLDRQPREYRDEGLNPTIAYRYRLRVDYTDGTAGETAASVRTPPLVNPSGFRAAFTSDDTVTLAWDATPGAVKYRIDGPGLASDGREVTATTTQISPIRGAATWQLSAIYAGGLADFGNRAVASTLPKPIPAHAPAYLSKPAGAGGAAETALHYARLCNWTDDSPGQCRGLRDYLDSWGVNTSLFSAADALDQVVRYVNTTDLAATRTTRCVGGSPTATGGWSQKRRFFGGGVVVCYANTGRSITVIIMNEEGARFAAFNDVSEEGDIYGDGWGNAILVPTTLLDSEGPKFLPHSCLACHGGRYDPSTQLVQGAGLLPIDPGLVRIVGDTATAQEKIRKINALVRQTYSSPAVAAYIDGLYGMDGTRHRVDETGAQASTTFVPSGWVTQRSLYLDFVKKDCAMCHLAGPPHLNFLTAGNFLSNKALIYAAVCETHSMPHSETSFINFWTRQSGAVFGPGFFAAALGYPSCE